MVASPTQLDFTDLPRRKGSYVLLLELATQVTLRVGRFGALDFSAGLYAYTGSARGPGGLAARLGHHLKRAERRHWHIDYLRRVAPIVALWAVWGPEAADLTECRLAARLNRQLPFRQPHKGFGSSDCTCHSHLLCWTLAGENSAALRSRTMDRVEKALSPLTRLG
jgi:Uri superfamily endonuclease